MYILGRDRWVMSRSNVALVTLEAPSSRTDESAAGIDALFALVLGDIGHATFH